ncbi:MAG: cupin domain-containing protein [Spirochaetia bacterium]|jgi:predicted cupin superfamily sugar epimerase|nr:cupin domain-containing protein [Spirochaetia bacterium]
MATLDATQLIEQLHLVPLEKEGGYFHRVMTFKDGKEKEAGSIIYYLMTENSFSALHRLAHDESWLFLDGDPVEQLQLLPDGTHSLTILGKAGEGYAPYALVENDCWQGTRLKHGGHWALVACVLVPAFRYDAFELGGRELLEMYPGVAFLGDFLAGKEA